MFKQKKKIKYFKTEYLYLTDNYIIRKSYSPEFHFYSSDNLALNKPAHEEYPYVHPDTSASNAVDGLKSDLTALGGQCSASASNQRTSTWWVNLTSIRSIHDIRIYYRTGNFAWGMYLKKLNL